METDIHRMLRRALTTLSGQRVNLDRQIAGVTAALQALGGRGTGSSARVRALAAADGRAPRRRPVSAAARKAASRRMKAYWAKRKAEAAKKAK